jgi:hypothetical protein
MSRSSGGTRSLSEGAASATLSVSGSEVERSEMPTFEEENERRMLQGLTKKPDSDIHEYAQSHGLDDDELVRKVREQEKKDDALPSSGQGDLMTRPLPVRHPDEPSD